MVLLLIAHSILAHAAGLPRSSPPPDLRVGTAAPSFSLLDTTGKQANSADWKGTTVVLNFWAFWCDTWKEEMPHLRELSARQKELGFRLVAISVDGTRLQEFSSRTGGRPPFPVLLDVGGQVSDRYHVSKVPTVIVLDPSGRVQLVRSGYPGNQAVLAAIRSVNRPH